MPTHQEPRRAGPEEATLESVVRIGLDGRIVGWTRSAQQVFGYSAEEAIGQPIQILVPPSRRREMRQVHALARTGALIAHLATVRLAKGGRPIHGFLSLSAIRDTTDRVVGLTGTFHPGTRPQCDQCAHASDGRRVNEELESFLHVAAHDLQEPLRRAALYADILSRRYSDKLDEAGQSYLAYIAQAGRQARARLASLANYILLGTGLLVVQPVDLSALVQGILAQMKERLEAEGAQVALGPLPVVTAQARQMSRLFEELLANALDYRGEPAPRVEISAVRRAGEWRFEVKDNGTGLDPAYAQRAFEPFERLNPADHLERAGMGLAICKRIVEMHHGRIWIDARLGAGVTVVFTLPAET